MTERPGPEKSPDAFRTISEVAEDLKLPQHVLRFWETRFPQIKPLKRAGGRRFYRPDDVALLRAIKALLYGQGYTIKGVQRLLQDQGPRGVAATVGPAIDEVSRPAGPQKGGEAGMADEDRDRAAKPAAPDAAPRPRRTAPPADPAAFGLPSGNVLGRLEALALDLADCARILAAAQAGRGRL
ncbi:MerR family transcriptional regulator [Lichenibacterium ramalinae]|uniref:MerR family transcriptional regulator n=1 Tax=Lichenibacterium ramalinae TaxID=2316527 RepID=A0A4V1RIU1_9HYPH|nr:MerR family transcriptional regulator [Lichenibacterium ramalinae]RYB05647.1 MerR family transcriptional regulator [Lichenibacterium ramalinae]